MNMILAFTGAGISCASGIPTFAEQPGIRDNLTRYCATHRPEDYMKTIRNMQLICDAAEPNDAHLALAEYRIPVITMNVDGLHQKAGSSYVLPIHGTLPDIVLYGDHAPLYQTAHDLVFRLRSGDFFLIIGTSYYTNIASQLKFSALGQGADVIEINDDAEHRVRSFLSLAETDKETFDEFLLREYNDGIIKPPYSL